MSSPFPGMNPYLENPVLWPGIHGRLIVFLADVLSPQLRPKYFVAIEERVYETTPDDRVLVGIPDVVVQRSQAATNNQTEENVALANPSTQPATVTLPIPQAVKERYLEVRKVGKKEVVAAIEVLSPKNKRTGEGRNAYEIKRNRVLASSTHFIEIDLLRGGESMPMLSNEIKSDYRILVSRSNKRPQADLYAFNLNENIPKFPLPLREGDREPIVDLQDLINSIYERASYDLVIDYSQEPIPELGEEDKIWVDELLKEQKLR